MKDECPASPLLEQLRQEEGQLRVIVELNVADLDDDKARREAIEQVQDELLAELEHTDAEVVHRYRNFPQLALIVDEAALCLLLVSPLVEAIHLDEADPPTE